MKTEDISPAIGTAVHVEKAELRDDEASQDVYTITLDPKINAEPEYVLGTYFWHMDGLTSPIIPPKASVLSARTSHRKAARLNSPAATRPMKRCRRKIRKISRACESFIV